MSCLICFEMKNTIYGKKNPAIFFYSNKSTRWYRNTEIVSIERLEARDYFWWSSRSYCRLAPLECPKLPSIRILDSNIWNFYEAFVPRSCFFCTKSRIITLMISNQLLKNQKRKNYFSKFKLLCVCFQYSGFNMSFWKG